MHNPKLPYMWFPFPLGGVFEGSVSAEAVGSVSGGVVGSVVVGCQSETMSSSLVD